MPSRLIEIPDGDIFKNDMLDLEPAIQLRSKELLSHRSRAIAIDGPWGSGKTTFMALWAAYLRRECVKVVTFNAWKFTLSDPFDTLTKEILLQFENVPKDKQKPAHRRLIELIQRGAPLVQRGTKLMSLLTPELAESAEAVNPLVDSAEAIADSVAQLRLLAQQAQQEPDG